MKFTIHALAGFAAVAAGFAAVYFLGYHSVGDRAGLLAASTRERMASPGALSRSHAFLEGNCAACHTAGKGVQAASCTACHAYTTALLQRQPTAFHADVGNCRDCHGEHRGIDKRPTGMDHGALAEIGLRRLKTDRTPDGGSNPERKDLLDWIGQHESAGHGAEGRSSLSPKEAVLNCAACHATKDRHAKLFGQDCAQCHGTAKWTIPEFRHPSSKSTDCVQCHQAPPSHYMMHFEMVSAKVALQPSAKVEQCYKCHQTTSWNDIKGVGWYKHH